MKVGIVVVIAALATLLLLVTIASANGGGHNQAQLERAGWACPNLGPKNWAHCFPPGIGQTAGPASTIQVKIFDDEHDFAFLGTELLIHEDLFAGQPCEQDGGSFTYLFPLNGLPYYACHHFDTAAAP